MSPKVTPANMRRLASQSELLNAAQGIGTICITGPTYRCAENLRKNLKGSFPNARMFVCSWAHDLARMQGRPGPLIVISTTEAPSAEMDALIRSHGWGFVHYDLSA